ncbi:MAG: aminoacyl-tRNA hydrolase [Myxococcales bacterium]
MADIKQVIVLRTDLNMRKGKMAAQAAHASMKVFFDRKTAADPARLDVPLWPEAAQWVAGAFTKIVVGCPSQDELLALEVKAREAGLPCALVIDAGATEFHGVPTPTALAIGPAAAPAIDALTGTLKLL